MINGHPFPYNPRKVVKTLEELLDSTRVRWDANEGS